MSHIRIVYERKSAWGIYCIKPECLLGRISLYTEWRKPRLIFEAFTNTIWTWDCLKEVAEFMKREEEKGL